jgi:hypothetical protein
MLKGIIAALALSMMLVASCSSSDSSGSNAFDCDNAKSKCANDPPLDPALCKRVINDANCGTVFLDVFLCIGTHQTCLADGTTDQTVTARECAAQQSAAEKCSPADGGSD